MEQRTDRIYPPAPLENNDLEKRLEKSFTNHIKNIKKMITYFQDKNHKSKRNRKV